MSVFQIKPPRPVPPEAPARDDPRRWWALGALCLSLLVVGLDGTVLNVALAHISAALRTSTTELQWVVNGFALTSAALLIPAGILGDRLGRGRMLAGGLGVFAVAAVVPATSQSAGSLIIARTVMGIGAAAVFPLALSIIPTIFSTAERARAVAAVTAALGLGMPLGPIIGGWLLDHYWWGSTMLMGVPLVLVALVAGLLVIPDSRDPSPRPLDVPGTACAVLGLGALVYGVIQAPALGWADPLVITALVSAAALGAALVVVERWAVAPLLDLELLRRPLFAWPTIATALTSFVMLGLLFTLPLYLQEIRGLTALATGIRLIPVMAALVVGAGVSGWVTARVGLRGAVALGLVVSCLGFVPILALGPGSTYLPLGVGLGLVGFGFGVSMTPAMDAVLGALPPGRESVGTALNLTLKQTGGVLGVAVLGSILAAAYSPTMHGVAAEAGFLTGMHRIALVCLVAALLTAVVMWRALPGPAPRGEDAPVA